jgi:methyltransferase
MKELYYCLVAFAAVQRMAELCYSRHNQQRLSARGFAIFDNPRDFLLMKLLHTFWFVSLICEPLFFAAQPPLWTLIPALVLFLGAEILRFWTLITLGAHWNVQVMAPQHPAGSHSADLFIASGPYRFIRHPNYLVVILEFACLPLIGGAYTTAALFSVLNCLVLRKRIRDEESLLFSRPGYIEAMRHKPRFIPSLIHHRG